jgi:hypothetical protein
MWWKSGFAKGEPRRWTKVHLWKDCKSISLLALKRAREWRNGGSEALAKWGNDDFMLDWIRRPARARRSCKRSIEMLVIDRAERRCGYYRNQCNKRTHCSALVSASRFETFQKRW